jgi:hypothetical protein
MKHVTNLLMVTVNGYKVVTKLLTNLSMVANLQWNLLQNRDETCYRLVNCYKLVMKLITYLFNGYKVVMKVLTMVTNFLFSVKGALKQGLFHQCRVWRWWSTLHVFCVVSKMMRLETSHLMHATVTKKRSTLLWPMFHPSGLFSFLRNWQMINLWQTRGATTWRPLYKRSTTVHGFQTTGFTVVLRQFIGLWTLSLHRRRPTSPYFNWRCPWTVPKTGSVLPLSEDFIHTWRTVRTVRRF